MNPEDGENAENGLLNNTRRQFVAGSAGALGGLAAGAGVVGPSLAQEEEDEDEEEVDDEEEEEEEEEELVEDEFEDDIEILNFARTLEFLEAEFYRQGLDNIGEEGLCNCDALQEDTALAERAYDELRTIQEHEEAHAEALGAAVEDLGGEPVEEPEFDFGLRVEFPGPFLATAVMLEDIGVSAYAGAAPFIENEELLAPALGIHSVEARHASFVRTLRNETGYPEVVDEARSRSEVLELAAPFIVDEEEDEEEVDEEEEEEEVDEEEEEEVDEEEEEEEVDEDEDDEEEDEEEDEVEEPGDEDDEEEVDDDNGNNDDN